MSPLLEEELKIGSTLQVKIEGIGSLGEGLARVGGNEIFIPKTAPGDEVEIQIIEKKKSRYRGILKKLLKAGSVRQPPPCKHFEICGGCDFQHIQYDEQLAWKLRQTKHWIRRSSLAPLLDKIPFDQIAAPSPFHYRHRARMQVKNKKLHFFKPHSNDLFEIEECPIMVNGFFMALQENSKEMPNTKDWSQSYMDGKLVESVSSYELDGQKISFDRECFTQGNLEVNALMWERVKEDVDLLERKESALDLFCGVGNFSLPLSNYFKTVTGVESSPQSIAWARKNSSKIRWIEGLSEEVLLDLEKKREFFDFILLDPPRAGANAVVRVLSRMLMPKITYISCSLESLVHDLVLLTKHGGYKIKRWTVADMFPQTHHIESIVSLSR
ncbi:MAG: rRNA (uracil-5-)-methyltransferase RumA [Bacteriovoracaceae bacterium]|nr:rRNA (uracil-5-)-methyltransferase RumA [Bacteriovoracaceae bacterium]